MSADHVAGGFVRRWFDLLSEHAPIEQLLPLVSDADLEMVFPEATLRSRDEFQRWYETVGNAYTDQGHVVKELDVHDVMDRADVALSVVWTATQRSDGAHLAYRVNQSWQLRRSPGNGEPVITRYRVLSMDSV
jgi:hypothetical protein